MLAIVRLALDSRLDSLPNVPTRRMAVTVTADALRRVRDGHPWVYDRAIRSVSFEGDPGQLAVVFDNRRRFAAVGIWDPASAIRIKVLHAGAPVAIDDTWWHDTFASAAERRASFAVGPDGRRAAYRLVNGESDGWPVVVVDRYANVAVVKVYSEMLLPHLRSVLGAIVSGTDVDAVVLRLGRSLLRSDVAALDGEVVAGSLDPGPVEFLERGLRFLADVRHGQKTGFFLDQRANRARVGKLSRDAAVLDVFAATGGFSVHAAAGGSRRVHSVDMSVPTLDAARRNMELNVGRAAVARCEHTVEAGDAFEVLRRLGHDRQRFDVVVVDPPSFANRQDQVDRALRAYSTLTRLALRTVVDGGVLVQASCSSRVTAEAFFDAVLGASARSGVSLHEIGRYGHDADHPVDFPEAAYLKAGFWRVNR